MEDERRNALDYQKNTGKTMYFYDDDGDEYWYSEKDYKRHYTREEG